MPRKGQAHTETAKAKISATQVAKFRASASEGLIDQPTRKMCVKCGEEKGLGDFYHQKVKLKSGLIRMSPEPRCKVCRRREFKEYKARRQEEGRPVVSVEDPKRSRARRREWAAQRRRELGIPPRNFKAVDKTLGSGLPTKPLAGFLEAEIEIRDMAAIEAATGVGHRQLYSIIHGEYETASISLIDRILTGLGCPEELHFLYPEDDSPTVGYHYLEDQSAKKPIKKQALTEVIDTYSEERGEYEEMDAAA